MLFQFTFISWLNAITPLLATASAHSIAHRHRARSFSPIEARQDAAGTVPIPLGQLQLLQSEYVTFQGWLDAWTNTTTANDGSVAQLAQYLKAYDGWMNTWLSQAIPAGSQIESSAIPATATSKLAVPSATPFVSSVASNAASSAPPSTPSIKPSSAAPVAPSSAPSGAAPSPVSSAGPATSSPATSSAASSPNSAAPVVPATSSIAASPSSVPVSDKTSSSSSGGVQGVTGNKLAVYYGQSPPTDQVPLSGLCSDSNVDIIILAFLTDFFGPGGYPKVDFGPACSKSPSAAAAAKGATGLLSCPQLASTITQCQSAGKKVLLSLGGAEATTAFSSDSQAQGFATQLWNLFGGGTSDADLRPFGSVKLDGFDIDNENKEPVSYTTFISALRSAMNTDTSKQYYISAAPQCPIPDASIPLSSMQTMDFVWVQFYNNGPCNIGQPGFLDSFKQWSSQLASNGKGPKLFIGAPASNASAGSGYLDPTSFGTMMQGALGANVPNFGGVMLWDGSTAKTNVVGGKDYLQVVKGALGS